MAITNSRAEDPTSRPRSSADTGKTSARISLDAEAIELLAELIAEKLEARTTDRTGWVSAEAVARHLGVNVQWVYDHGYELGGVRLGDGTTQGRWRFRLDRIDDLLQSSAYSADRTSGAQHARTVERKTRRARRRLAGTGPALLPVKGHSGSPSKRK